MKLIYSGLLLQSSKCKYFQIKEGKVCSISENPQTSTLTLTYTLGDTAESVASTLGLQRVGKDCEMTTMNSPKRYKDTYVILNGLRLRKLTQDPHTINIIIVSDSESRVVQDYNYTTIVVSTEDYKNQDFINFLFYSGNLKFLEPVGPKPKGCWELRNFPKILVKDRDINLESDSEVIYQLRKKYNDYVIREIDYQDQFVLEIRRILTDYGIELVRLNKETTLQTTSYVTYQFLQTPTNNQHPTTYFDNYTNVLNHTIPVEFTLHTPDAVMFFDFKNKYNNVNLLTNFCTFYTTDKYGERWSAAIKWGRISEEFNHTYQQDDNANFALQCTFRCDLYFYEVMDDRYEFLDDIIYNLETTG